MCAAMHGLTVLAFVAVLCTPAAALYSKKDDVVQMDAKALKEALDGDSLLLVEFYAPWCGHCKNLAPEWKKAAKALKDSNVVVAAVDATVHNDLASKYGIKGFPTIKVFGDNRKKPTDYNGAREAKAIIEFAKREAKGMKGGGGGGGGGKKGGDGEGGKAPKVKSVSYKDAQAFFTDPKVSECVLVLAGAGKGAPEKDLLEAIGRAVYGIRANATFGTAVAGDAAKIAERLGVAVPLPAIVVTIPRAAEDVGPRVYRAAELTTTAAATAFVKETLTHTEESKPFAEGEVKVVPMFTMEAKPRIVKSDRPKKPRVVTADARSIESTCFVPTAICVLVRVDTTSQREWVEEAAAKYVHDPYVFVRVRHESGLWGPIAAATGAPEGTRAILVKNGKKGMRAGFYDGGNDPAALGDFLDRSFDGTGMVAFTEYPDVAALKEAAQEKEAPQEDGSAGEEL